MGLKTIADKRKEFREAYDAQDVIVTAIKDIEKAANEVRKKLDALEKEKEAAVKRMKQLNADKWPEFDQFKEKMIAALESPGPRYLPIPDPGALDKVVKKAKEEVDEAVTKWVEKLAASFPAEIKVGMTFLNTATKDVFEVVKGPFPATNEKLTGDDAVVYDVKSEKGAKFPLSKKALSPGGLYKYLKT